jgi:hypothetical protein
MKLFIWSAKLLYFCITISLKNECICESGWEYNIYFIQKCLNIFQGLRYTDGNRHRVIYFSRYQHSGASYCLHLQDRKVISSTLKMEVIGSTKRLVPIHQSTWCHILEDHNSSLFCLYIIIIFMCTGLFFWTLM